MRAIAAGLTDVGLQREHNEDSFIVLQEFDLFVVADGMGGHRAGHVASKLATETIGEFFKSTANDDVTWPFHFDTNLSEEENRLLTGIRVANRQIFERSTRSHEYRGMGTTVVGAMFSPSKRRMFIGHVGDSRCYRVRAGKIELLTRDHSLINDYLLAMPDLTEEQRSELPKNVITRALGMQDQVVVDLQHDDPHIGDVYVLCSDGLSGMVTDEEIVGIVNDNATIADACRSLIQKANDQGGEDNITAVIIKIEEVPDTVVQPKPGRVSALAATAPLEAHDPATFADEPTMPGGEASAKALAVAKAKAELAAKENKATDPPASIKAESSAKMRAAKQADDAPKSDKAAKAVPAAPASTPKGADAAKDGPKDTPKPEDK